MTRYTQFGTPLSKDKLGRGYGDASMAAIAADVGATREHGGDEVRHVCPECGGPLNQGATLAVETCTVCRGVGTLSDDELMRYLAVLNSGGRLLG